MTSTKVKKSSHYINKARVIVFAENGRGVCYRNPKCDRRRYIVFKELLAIDMETELTSEEYVCYDYDENFKKDHPLSLATLSRKYYDKVTSDR